MYIVGANIPTWVWSEDNNCTKKPKKTPSKKQVTTFWELSRHPGALEIAPIHSRPRLLGELYLEKMQDQGKGQPMVTEMLDIRILEEQNKR